MIYQILITLSITFVFSSFVLPTFAADGDVDPLFLTARGFDDDVSDISIQQDGKLVIVGEFTSVVGAPLKRVARLDLNGNVDLTFKIGTGTNGNVYVVKVLPDGKILIGGDFTNYNGIPVNRIVRLNSDGTLDSTFNIGSGASGGVHQIILQPDNKLLISGVFSTFNGESKNGVVRLSYDGEVDQEFSPTNLLQLNGPIYALSLQPDGKVLIGGLFFNSDNGLNRNIARLEANGTLDTSFNAQTNSSFFAAVRSIRLRTDQKILVGGGFTTVNGTTKIGIALLDSNGVIDSSFNTSGINTVSKIELQNDGKIVLAGSFPRPQGLSWTVIRLNSDGTTDDFFDKNEFEPVNTILITSDNKIIAGGYMFQNSTSVGGANRAGVRRFNSNGTRDNSYLTRTGAAQDTVTDMVVQPDGKIVILGGGFTVGGLSRSGVARLNADGTVDENFAPGFGGSGIASLPDGGVVVGGVNTTISGLYHFRKINPDGSIDTSYMAESQGPSTSGVSNIEDMVSQPDGKVIAVGSFESINGTARKSIVRLDTNGSIDTSFNPNLVFNEANIRTVTLQPDGKILIGGRFINGSGTPSFAVFRLNTNGIVDGTFGPVQPDNTIYDISYQNDGKIFICGFFNSINSFPKKYIVRLNANGTIDSSFMSPVVTGSPNTINVVLSQQFGKVIIGGEFDTVNGVSRKGIARLNANGSFDSSFNTIITSSHIARLYGLAQQPDGKILIGGDLSAVNGITRNYIARLLNTTKTTVFDFDGDEKADISIFRPSSRVWAIQNSLNSSNNIQQFGLSDDQITPSDFDGDGKTDIAVFRPSTGRWYWLNSSNSSFSAVAFGTNGDVPAPADYDGDGKADLTVFRPSNGTWYRLNSSNGSFSATQFGISEDTPTIGDFDGDGKADIAVFRPSTGSWYRLNSSTGQFFAVQFGVVEDKPTPADFDGDGKTDISVFRPSNGTWYRLNSSNGSFAAMAFGIAEDRPVAADYDGDGKADIAVFRPSEGNWYLLKSTQGFAAMQFGVSEDKPTPNAFVR